MNLTAHFTAAELGADTPGISAAALSNLHRVALWLESARSVLGAPLRVTSGYRSPQHNASVGGSSTSDHVTGLAADFVPVNGPSQLQAYQLLKAARERRELPPFDQLIFYPVTGHIHVGLGVRMRGEYRIALAEGGFPILTGSLAQQLRGAAPLLLILIVVLLIAASRKGA